jgi:hypothetical protein
VVHSHLRLIAYLLMKLPNTRLLCAGSWHGRLKLSSENRLESKAPIILEGDFPLPALAPKTSFCGYPGDGQVCAIVIDEDDEAQLLRNFEERESISQPKRPE